jgi:diguanylate cyclase (GGDEF)-like protein
MNIAHEHSLIDDSVTISIGVSTSDGKNKLTSPETLIVAADKALYMAKNNGRNRAESISPSATF